MSRRFFLGLLLGLVVFVTRSWGMAGVSVSAPSSATVSSSFYVSASGYDDAGTIVALTITMNGGYVCSSNSGSYSISTGGYASAPATTGTATVQAILDFDYSYTDTAYVAITIAAPAITSSLTKTGVAGTSLSYTITGSNSPTSYNATGLPSGLSVNTSTGVISGTPSSAGTSNVTISATNAGGTGSATLVITVNPATPAITSALTKTGSVGSALSYTITASNSPTSYNATGLPSGLSVNTSTGVISGTPTTIGTTNVTISATNVTGTGSATLVITVNPPAPGITSALTKWGFAGTSLSYTITASNSPTSYNATGLPSGLSINTSTGVISGTPTAAGSTNVTISATNVTGTGSATLYLTVEPAIPVITSPLTATGTAGAAFSYTITTTNSPYSRTAYSLPSGLSVDTATGVISGTVATAGTYSVTIAAYASLLSNDSKTLVITIYPPVPVISSASTAIVAIGTSFSYTITASNSPTSYGATNLPPGLSVNTSTGVISGTPTTLGTYSTISLSATNAGGTGTQGLTITVGNNFPSSLYATDVGPTSFTLHWTPPFDGTVVTDYKVSLNGSVIASSTAGAAAIAVTGLSPATTYVMSVQSRNAAGTWSSSSPTYDVTTATDADGDGLSSAEETALGTSASTTATPTDLSLSIHRP